MECFHTIIWKVGDTAIRLYHRFHSFPCAPCPTRPLTSREGSGFQLFQRRATFRIYTHAYEGRGRHDGTSLISPLLERPSRACSLSPLNGVSQRLDRNKPSFPCRHSLWPLNRKLTSVLYPVMRGAQNVTDPLAALSRKSDGLTLRNRLPAHWGVCDLVQEMHWADPLSEKSM